MSVLPDYASALESALRGIVPLDRTEMVELRESGGRVLAEPIKADRDLPPFNRAQMDGYAVRAADFSPGRAWPVAGKVAAGASADIRVPPGHCVAVATGAALPADVDAVIQHEASDRGDVHGRPVRFTINAVAAGLAVHHRGVDAKIGDVLVSANVLLQAHHIGIAAAAGHTALRVRARPQTTILTSGDEIVSPSPTTQDLSPVQVRNSNGPAVCELLKRFGAEVSASHHLPDEREPTISAVARALIDSDIVITIGGVSAGERDHFPAAFDANGIERSLQGASIQPGRPIVVGHAANGAIVIGLPGNPVSVLACACLFAWPIVRCMLGLNPQLPWRNVTLGEAVKPNPHRRAFRPAILREDNQAVVPAWAGSGDLAHTAPTHGLIELPVQDQLVPARTTLRLLPWP